MRLCDLAGHVKPPGSAKTQGGLLADRRTISSISIKAPTCYFRDSPERPKSNGRWTLSSSARSRAQTTRMEAARKALAEERPSCSSISAAGRANRPAAGTARRDCGSGPCPRSTALYRRPVHPLRRRRRSNSMGRTVRRGMSRASAFLAGWPPSNSWPSRLNFVMFASLQNRIAEGMGLLLAEEAVRGRSWTSRGWPGPPKRTPRMGDGDAPFGSSRGRNPERQ